MQTTLKLKIDATCSYEKSTLCAINEINNSNICFGDSGTPLMLKYKDRWYAYGIASFSLFQRKNICDGKHPSYFTNILYYQSWIQSKLKANKNENHLPNLEY